MGYRRSRREAADAAKWRAFRFSHFLMHGCIDHHPIAANFDVKDLTAQERAALKTLITEYLRAGFPDPGLVLFSAAEHDAIRRAALGEPQRASS